MQQTLIKWNQNFTGRLQAHRTFWSLHRKLRIKWNHKTEPSRVHAANSKLNRTRTHQEALGSQNLQESTALPFPPRLVLRLSPSLGRAVFAPLSWQTGCSDTPLRLPGTDAADEKLVCVTASPYSGVGPHPSPPCGPHGCPLETRGSY